MAKRLHYIDWLRVLAVLLLFPFHTLRVYNMGEDFYIKAPELSAWANQVIGFIDRWHMPLLFLLAGASSYFALKRRTAGQYVNERVARLLVPLLFGILFIIPPQTYIGARYNSGYTESFWHYIVSGDFLRWNIQEAGDYYGGFGIGHLWFILFLFVLSLVALPLFLWWRKPSSAGMVARWSRRLASPGWWIAPAVLLWIAEDMEIVGKGPVYYLLFMLFGYLAMADEGFMAEVERLWGAALLGGMVVTAVYVATWPWRDALPDPSLSLALFNIIGMLATWSVIVGLLGFGKAYLDEPSPALAYLAEGSYPIYILHQTVIVVLAWWVVRLPISWLPQWLVLLAASVAVTFGLYEVVRRVRLLRVPFGLKRAPRVAPPAPGAAA